MAVVVIVSHNNNMSGSNKIPRMIEKMKMNDHGGCSGCWVVSHEVPPRLSFEKVNY
jgi:hypothetical protein